MQVWGNPRYIYRGFTGDKWFTGLSCKFYSQNICSACSIVFYIKHHKRYWGSKFSNSLVCQQEVLSTKLLCLGSPALSILLWWCLFTLKRSCSSTLCNKNQVFATEWHTFERYIYCLILKHDNFWRCIVARFTALFNSPWPSYICQPLP